MYDRAQRRIALVYGFVCHVSFALGIVAMMVAIHQGLTLGRGRLAPGLAVMANTALLLQFAAGHSLLLSDRGRRWLMKLAPRGLGKDLSTTIYATIASWQLLLTFVLWTPSGIVWWAPSGALFAVSTAAYGAAWLLLLKTMADAGLGVQTGFLGWSSVARNRVPQYAPFRPRGTFRMVRQPIYVAFAMTLWLAPVWTPDRLVLALGWTAYCVLGPLLKERRYERFYGDAFASYRASVPYWLPRPSRIAGRARRA